MNFIPFKKARATLAPPPRPVVTPAGRPHAVWSRDPGTGRLVQAWQGEDDPERSCTGRPSGPRRDVSNASRRQLLAA